MTTFQIRIETAAKAKAFLDENPDIAEWFAENAGWMEFARSLLAQLLREGALSVRQIAAVKKSAAKMGIYTKKPKLKQRPSRRQRASLV
jgi:hypothetical protein